ncbi:MAG: hypothetical protein AB7S75_14590 [Desulfococcaceae bacterium]
MKKEMCDNTGIRMLVEHYRKMFRIPENIYYYSEADYVNAERNFIKTALQNGKL